MSFCGLCLHVMWSHAASPSHTLCVSDKAEHFQTRILWENVTVKHVSLRPKDQRFKSQRIAGKVSVGNHSSHFPRRLLLQSHWHWQLQYSVLHVWTLGVCVSVAILTVCAVRWGVRDSYFDGVCHPLRSWPPWRCDQIPLHTLGE